MLFGCVGSSGWEQEVNEKMVTFFLPADIEYE